MSDLSKVAFIGAGNLAWHLAPALDNTGFPVREVYSRNLENAKALVKRLYESVAVDNLDFSESSCNIFILAVADDALEYVATEIILPDDAIVVHTSGTQPLSILGYLPIEDIGVFYPLQTFSRNRKVSLSNVPIFIEGETEKVISTLTRMATNISSNVNKLGSFDRKWLHLAAVYASNFTNHLLSLSKDILDSKGLEVEYLHPLIEETVHKAIENGPVNSQTGPAVRADHKVIQQHLLMLSQQENLSAIYELLSESINKLHNADHP